MQVDFSQIYIEPGVSFRFSHVFQNRLSESVTSLVVPSSQFVQRYGTDSDLIFNVSAKASLRDNEIRGPAVFRWALKSRGKTSAKQGADVEYTIFMPHRVIMQSPDPDRSAVRYLLKGACAVLESLDIETAAIKESQDSLIKELVDDPSNFEEG